jgi:hypothetical protein
MLSKKKVTYKGSCLCGNIRFEVDEIEAQMAHCHCKMCQKFTGAAFATYGESKSENFRWVAGEDLLSNYVGRNGTTRQFCSTCGSSLTFEPSQNSDKAVEFSLGALDDEIPNRPDAHVFVSSKPCWNEITDRLPQYRDGRIIDQKK